MTTLDNPDPLLLLNRQDLNEAEEDVATSALAEEIFGKQINTAAKSRKLIQY